MASVEAARMTEEEFLALPDDGIRRMLIDGVVREIGMTIRRWRHGALQMRLGTLLNNWSDRQPLPRGHVVGGETGFRLSTGTLVGLDVAYASPELAVATPDSQAIFQGNPTLAVEILSPSDSVQDVDDKIEAYLGAGVPLVWVVQPRHRTVTVYRPDAVPPMFTHGDEIAAEPHLPGFRAAVAAIFED
jgi:Uma2 family endonuclease